jgi:hypothetical protein
MVCSMSFENMVKIKSPLRSKDLDAGAELKGLFGIHGKAIEVFDNDRMVILNLKKGERLAVFDKNDKPWELSKNAKGRLN